jgi:hypothetical protein
MANPWAPVPQGVAPNSLTGKFVSSAIPFVNLPTGTMNNNGAYVLGTALSRTVPSGYAWCATNTISAATPAGWYWFTMSSASAMTLFNNTYVAPGVPIIQTNPVAFVTTGVGAVTGVTGTLNAIQIVLPAACVGPSGYVRFTESWSVNNSASNKILNVTLAAISLGGPTVTTVVNVTREYVVFNNNYLNAVSPPAGVVAGTGSAAGITLSTAVNFGNANTLIYAPNMALATDWIIQEAFGIEFYP